MKSPVRSMLSFLVLSFVALSVGCKSYTRQFTSAASPIATRIVEEQLEYEQDGNEDEERANAFLVYINSGDRENALPLWFGVPGVRSAYVENLNGDVSLAGSDGEITKGILMGNVATLDYILAIKQVPAKTP